MLKTTRKWVENDGFAQVAPLPLFVENLLRPLLEVLGAQRTPGDDWQQSEEAASEVDRIFGKLRKLISTVGTVCFL